jgi:hypothetical protein
MTLASGRDGAWERLRYARLLPLAGRGHAAAHAYAELVATVELRRDPERGRAAQARIERWLGATPRRAQAIHRASLRSEALEEADTLRLMRGTASLGDIVTLGGFADRGRRPRVYATLHYGSPVAAYLALCRREPHLRIIARRLDEGNPMPAVKRDFGRRKVEWVEATAGWTFLETDAAATLRAREHLLQGHALYAAVDVPGDVVARADRMRLCGEPVILASGVFRLAAMAGADFQMVLAEHRGGRIRVRCRPPVEGSDAMGLAAAVVGEIEAAVRERPEEWWFWPFVATGY